MTWQDVIGDGLAEISELDAAAKSVLVDKARRLQTVCVDELARDQAVAADPSFDPRTFLGPAISGWIAESYVEETRIGKTRILRHREASAAQAP